MTEEGIRKYVESIGVKVQFVSVNKRKAGDRRNTTFARIGTDQTYEDKRMDGSNWKSNITIRPWIYYRRVQTQPGRNMQDQGNG